MLRTTAIIHFIRDACDIFLKYLKTPKTRGGQKETYENEHQTRKSEIDIRPIEMPKFQKILANWHPCFIETGRDYEGSGGGCKGVQPIIETEFENVTSIRYNSDGCRKIKFGKIF